MGGSKQSGALDSRDFNSFADRVTELISDECSIVYTDFACHVAPIVLALVLNIHVLQQCASSRSHIGSGSGSGIEKPGRK